MNLICLPVKEHLSRDIEQRVEPESQHVVDTSPPIKCQGEESESFLLEVPQASWILQCGMVTLDESSTRREHSLIPALSKLLRWLYTITTITH
jgi:hypothetical protein